MDDLKDMIIKELQGNLLLVQRPFEALAEKLGVNEQEVLNAISELKKEGRLRRLATVLRHQKAGFDANAMVAWRVDEDQCQRVGELMASFPEVSHCYWRDTPSDWDYNIFCMVHARNQAELQEIIEELANYSGIADFVVLETQRELKKTSVYFR